MVLAQSPVQLKLLRSVSVKTCDKRQLEFELVDQRLKMGTDWPPRRAIRYKKRLKLAHQPPDVRATEFTR